MKEPDYEEAACTNCCPDVADAGHANERWPVNRRALLAQTTAALLGGQVALRPPAAAAEPAAAESAGLALKDFQPKSMLHVPETRVPREIGRAHV
jgi:hypothetical protein